MKWEQEQQRRNREAEESAVRKNVWGWKGEEVPEDEMGDQIVLGDLKTENITYANPPQTQSSGIAKTLAAAGLAAAGLGAGVALPIAAYQLLRTDTTVVVPPSVDTDTDTKYGLQIYRE